MKVQSKQWTGIGKILLLTVLYGILLKAGINVSHAKSTTVIRDSEIETYLKEWSEPILKAAGMSKNSVNVVLVQDGNINAFVAGGANIFFYTGLLEKTETPGEVLGVFAHELGHISGGHLIKNRDALERASYESILGTVLGIGAAVLSGDGRAAAAVMGGGQNIAQSNYLAHSRANESSADQAALTYFEKAKFNPAGLASFLEKLKHEELLPASQQSEYTRTHPLTINRIEAVEGRSRKSPYQDAQFPEHWQDQHDRMRAKLIAYVTPGRVAWEYDDSDMGIPARYARTIAAYRENHVEEAIQKVDALISDEPQNPYFYELKGQMLVDFARVEDALQPYRKAISLKPGESLFRIAYAHALIESSYKAEKDRSRVLLQDALEQLLRAEKKDRHSARIHRLLATAYGRLGDENMAKIHLAEEAVLHRQLSYAEKLLGALLAEEAEGSAAWKRAYDLNEYIKTLKKK